MPKYGGVGQKQKSEKKKKKERPKVGNKNGQLRIATPPRVVHVKPPGPISVMSKQYSGSVISFSHITFT